MWYRQIHEGWYQDVGTASKIEIEWEKSIPHHQQSILVCVSIPFIVLMRLVGIV